MTAGVLERRPYVARKETSVGVTEASGKAGAASAPRTQYSSSSFSCWSCRRDCDSFSRASRAEAGPPRAACGHRAETA